MYPNKTYKTTKDLVLSTEPPSLKNHFPNLRFMMVLTSFSSMYVE